MEFKPEVKVLKTAQIMNASTDAEWLASNPVIPTNMMCYASDTGVIKIGNGASTWTELPVFYSQSLVDSVQHVRFVADIAARDALTGSDKNGLVVVIDASGDTTITDPTLKEAGYVWNETDSVWVKIFERESMDIDLTPYFNMTANTSDDITEGAAKLLMTVAERALVAELDTNAVRYTDSIVVQGVNAAELLEMLDA